MSPRTLLSPLFALALIAGVFALAAPAAQAATDEVYPETVTADALPTVQVNGVVWDQEIVGNTVYAVGNFSQARPAGAAPGTQQVARSNMLAYNLQTGALITGFAPTFNGQIQSVSAAPDGSRIYVGGQFTTVNGQARNRIAALNPTTGALVPGFTTGANATVYTVYATQNTLYVGGNFTSLGGGNARLRAAAINTANGAVLPFAPSVDNRSVRGIVGYGGKVAIGGNFTTVNGSGNPGYGLALLDAATGASLPMAANNKVRNGDDDAAIWALNGDDSGIYGAGFHFGPGGTTEGSFRIDWDGNLVWIADCHGDTYDVAPDGDVAYQASHKHYCGNLGTGGFPQTEPDWTFYRATATTNYATGVNKPDIYGYPDVPGEPSPTLLPFFPTLNLGTFTGMYQGPWTVETNGDYVVFGGEFTTANGVGQQGLVRFAKSSIAPNNQGPRLSGNAMAPSLRSLVAGGVRVSWPANWDRDDDTLTYRAQRLVNNQWVTVHETTQRARFWEGTAMTYFDTGLPPGSTQTYRVVTLDPDGNQATSAMATVTVADSGELGEYGEAVYADGATKYWRLGESDNTVVDWAGGDDTTIGNAATRGITPGAMDNGDAATRFPNNNNGRVISNQLVEGPNTFSYEVWFRTTSSSGGKIVGFGNRASGNSTSYDRHLYMDGQGRVTFGIWTGAQTVVSSGTGYNDGQWHQAVATLGSDGLALYLDGKRIGRNTSATAGQSYSGYWRLGGDTAWAGDANFDGDIDEFSLYPTVLTAEQVDAHWVASGRTSTIPPRPTDLYGQVVYDAEPDVYWRLDEASGDALDSSLSGNHANVTGTVTRGVEGAVGANPAFGLGNEARVVAKQSVANPTVFSQEVWIRTTTTQGGRIIGFGNQPAGNSNNYDRHLWMLDDGRVVFGTYTGVENRVTSPDALNDGEWHHVVTQIGVGGMRLFVDGQQVASNPNTGSENYTGYWRLGGDNAWGGNTSQFFAGDIDEAAIYPRLLSAQEVHEHFVAGGGNTAPTAAFTSTADGLTVTFDSTGSGDAEGSITYAWDFGDGATSTEENPEHEFADTGVYTVTLTVTDQHGIETSVAHQVAVERPNTPPVAAFSAAVDGLEVEFTDASTDADGSIVAWAWDFGDGATSAEQHPTHVYADGDVRTVTLTVTDDRGDTHETTQDVDPNTGPAASFTSNATGLGVAFASTSTDDAAVTGWAWDFGDGSTSIAANPNHLYDKAGTYTVTLTVTDAQGLSDSASETITVAPIPNQPPTAAFTANVTGDAVAVDANGSTDADGTIASYEWDFGDGATGSGVTAQHVYEEAGDYTIELTVTDDDGSSATTTRDITITLPQPGTEFASDAFGRTVVNGWGTADLGGAWTTSGTASNWQVSGGTGRVTLPNAGNGRNALLSAVASDDTEFVGTFSLDKSSTGGGQYVNLMPRAISTSTNYRIKTYLTTAGAVRLEIARVASGAETTLAWTTVPGLTAAAGQSYTVRAKASGVSPTQLAGKIWLTGSAEPEAWTVEATDSTAALQAPGGVGLYAYLSGSASNAPLTITFDDLVAASTAPPVPNEAPTAAFTTAIDGGRVSFTSTATDADGTIAAHAWSFGDGATSTDASPVHDYAESGTYDVTLTVTDDDGDTDSVTQQVEVVVPPNQAPTAAFTVAASGARVTFTSTATDVDGTIAAHEWSFGDGATSTDASPVHDYAESGTYDVTLTVTDDDGDTDSVTQQVEVVVPPNQAPTADFTASVNGSTASFDGSGSADPDGSIASWSWDFGDESEAGSGETTSHQYAEPGTYDVTLTVTDDDGETDSVTQQVVIDDGPAVLARDTFERTVAAGFGTADVGGAWTQPGSAANMSVADGGGHIRMNSAGSGPRVYLGDVASADTESTVLVSLDKAPAGGDVYITLGARRVGNSEYRLKARFQPNSTMLLLTRAVNNVETNLSVAVLPALRYEDGDVFVMRLLIDGTSQSGKLWRFGDTEPGDWQVQASDATPQLAGAGGITLQAYASGAVSNAPVVARFDELTVTEAP